MNNVGLHDAEVVTPAEVHRAARAFAAALAETPQFTAFKQADEALSNDTEAQQALSRLQAKAKSLRALLMLNAVSDAERAELDGLRDAYLTRATVRASAAAEGELTGLCQQAARIMSAATGMDYAATCGASCCG